MGQLVVHGVGEGGRFVLVDRHRRVVREVGLVQHREHWVSWVLSSLMINWLLINRRIKLRKKWLPPMARKGALIPRTSSSLIPANPGRQILSSFFHKSRFNISWRIWISATPESISLWPAISFIHFFLLNWKKRFSNLTLEFISNHKPVRRSCERLNARRSRDRLGNCSVISCQTPAYVFLNQDVWIFLPAPGYVFLNERDRVSSWYSWGATWVETLYEAVVRPLVADIEGCRNWAPVRVLPTWMEDFLRCTKIQHFAKICRSTKSLFVSGLCGFFNHFLSVH